MARYPSMASSRDNNVAAGRSLQPNVKSYASSDYRQITNGASPQPDEAVFAARSCR
jgi:hypothetical protein